MWAFMKPNSKLSLRVWQLAILVVLLVVWQIASQDQKIAFFFGKPLGVWHRIWDWFFANGDIYSHLAITLTETILAFFIGTSSGLGVGLWLGLSPMASTILDPFIKAANSMPRVILAPIFAMWFGLGIWSKVALAVTLVFFIVFFNVYQGVREVSPTPECWEQTDVNYSDRCICRQPRAGFSQAFIPQWVWLLLVRWWVSILALLQAWGI